MPAACDQKCRCGAEWLPSNFVLGHPAPQSPPPIPAPCPDALAPPVRRVSPAGKARVKWGGAAAAKEKPGRGDRAFQFYLLFLFYQFDHNSYATSKCLSASEIGSAGA